MTTERPEALRLASDIAASGQFTNLFTLDAAAAELRTQHARIADLEAQLEAIGAGGVSGPLIGQPQAMPDLSQLTERGAKAWAGVDAQGLREGFTAADMATAAADGFRSAAAMVAKLKGERMVLCALLGECLPVIDALMQMPGDDDSDARLNGLAGRINDSRTAVQAEELPASEGSN